MLQGHSCKCYVSISSLAYSIITNLQHVQVLHDEVYPHGLQRPADQPAVGARDDPPLPPEDRGGDGRIQGPDQQAVLEQVLDQVLLLRGKYK